MQFFPSFNQSLNSSDPKEMLAGGAFSGKASTNPALWGKQGAWGKTAVQKAGKSLNFAAALGDLNNELKELNLKEFNPGITPGAAPGFASTKDDTSLLKARDLNFLESKLRRKGVDEDVLQDFMGGLYSGAELPGVGRIMGAARNMGRQGEALNDQEKIAFSSLMQRIGYSNEEIVQMEELSHQGKGLKILENVEKRISQLADPAFRENLSRQLASASEKLQGQTGAAQNAAANTGNAAANTGNAAGTGKESAPTLLTDVLHVTKEELSALTKLFNLSEKAGANILTVFGDQPEANISGKDFSKLFGTAKAELERESAGFAKLREAVPGAIKDMLDNAKIVSTTEANADRRGSRKLERSEILMRDTATLSNDEDEKGNTAIRGKSILSELSAKADQSATERNISENLRNSRNHETGQNAAGRDTDDKNGGKFGQGADKNEGRREFSDALKQDADKAFAKAENAALSGKEILAAKTESSAGAIFSLAPQNASSTGNEPRAAVFHERIFQQVEQGILKHAIDGSRQITLRLDPPDLGRLTLSLTVANGEVKALIRTEQSEVTRVVSEQVAALKSSLEEQGFKVTSLEVETKPQNDPNMDNWTSAEQHNKEQELEARANFLKLSRNRAKEGEALAQNVQSTDEPATISETGLHIVA